MIIPKGRRQLKVSLANLELSPHNNNGQLAMENSVCSCSPKIVISVGKSIWVGGGGNDNASGFS